MSTDFRLGGRLCGIALFGCLVLACQPRAPQAHCYLLSYGPWTGPRSAELESVALPALVQLLATSDSLSGTVERQATVLGPSTTMFGAGSSWSEFNDSLLVHLRSERDFNLVALRLANRGEELTGSATYSYDVVGVNAVSSVTASLGSCTQ